MRALARIGVYPDPDSGDARCAAAIRYRIAPDSFIFADGADSLIFALPHALGASSCITPSPSYSGYLRAADRAGLPIFRIPLDPRIGYSLASEEFTCTLAEVMNDAPSPALVFLGAPNNPAGGSMDRELLLELAYRYPGSFFALDESLRGARGGGPGYDRLVRAKSDRAALPHEDLGRYQARVSDSPRPCPL